LSEDVKTTAMVGDVSVIVPAYNARSTIHRALEGVSRQTLKPREVIVVDDGSSDGTAEEARACAASLNGVDLIVVEQPNAGAGAARNRAVFAAHGRYLAFLDADDEWLPEKLERSLSLITQGSLTLIAHNGWIVADGQVSEIDIASRFRASFENLPHGLYRRGFISTSSVVARRDAVTAAGGFDETLRVGQDFDLWLKMLCKPNAQYEVFDDKLTRYHISRQGITSNSALRLADTLRIAVRHAPSLYRCNRRFVSSLWFRIVALHVEACTALWRRGQSVAAIRVLAMLPFRLLSLTLRAVSQVRRESVREGQ